MDKSHVVSEQASDACGLLKQRERLETALRLQEGVENYAAGARKSHGSPASGARISRPSYTPARSVSCAAAATARAAYRRRHCPLQARGDLLCTRSRAVWPVAGGTQAYPGGTGALP